MKADVGSKQTGITDSAKRPGRIRVLLRRVVEVGAEPISEASPRAQRDHREAQSSGPGSGAHAQSLGPDRLNIGHHEGDRHAASREVKRKQTGKHRLAGARRGQCQLCHTRGTDGGPHAALGDEPVQEGFYTDALVEFRTGFSRAINGSCQCNERFPVEQLILH